MVSVEQSHLDIVHATGREVDVSEVPQVKNDIEVDLGGHGGSEQVGDGLELMGMGEQGQGVYRGTEKAEGVVATQEVKQFIKRSFRRN